MSSRSERYTLSVRLLPVFDNVAPHVLFLLLLCWQGYHGRCPLRTLTKHNKKSIMNVVIDFITLTLLDSITTSRQGLRLRSVGPQGKRRTDESSNRRRRFTGHHHWRADEPRRPPGRPDRRQ